eukprot:1948271-Prymnesium_polylepis.1
MRMRTHSSFPAFDASVRGVCAALPRALGRALVESGATRRSSSSLTTPGEFRAAAVWSGVVLWSLHN